MALVSFQLDPATGGVSQSEFDAHTHTYRKVTQIAADISKNWVIPTRTDVIDDTETWVTDDNDLEAIGITVATSSTGTPE